MTNLATNSPLILTRTNSSVSISSQNNELAKKADDARGIIENNLSKAAAILMQYGLNADKILYGNMRSGALIDCISHGLTQQKARNLTELQE